MFTNARPFRLFSFSKARTTARRVSETEQLVAVLSLTGMDLTPAQETLASARELYAAGEYSDAGMQADCAEALALQLNERFDAYLAAWKEVQACIAGLQGCGLPTDALEDILDSAEREVGRRVEEEGTAVPNYVGATAILEEAREAAHRVVDHARIAVREIRLASISVEALTEPRAGATNSSLALRLERIIEQATRELALGHVEAAHQIASGARLRADHALAGVVEATKLLDDATTLLGCLGAEGPAAESLAEKAASARCALSGGLSDANSVVEAVRRTSAGVADFASHYAHFLPRFEAVHRRYVRLEEQGVRSDDIELALAEAWWALQAGAWSGLEETLEGVAQALDRAQAERKTSDVPSCAAPGADEPALPAPSDGR